MPKESDLPPLSARLSPELYDRVRNYFESTWRERHPDITEQNLRKIVQIFLQNDENVQNVLDIFELLDEGGSFDDAEERLNDD